MLPYICPEIPPRPPPAPRGLHHTMALAADLAEDADKAQKDWGAVSQQDEALSSSWERTLSNLRREGDIEGMKQLGAIMGEAKIVEHIMDPDPDVSLKAATYAVEQAGHGTIKRVEAVHTYKSLPPNELNAMVLSKLIKICKLNPQFKLSLPKNLVTLIEDRFPDYESSPDPNTLPLPAHMVPEP